MAILETSTKTGISWVKESVDLFKTAPRKWLSLALAYVGFVLLPSALGLQLLVFINTLILPVFLVIAMMMYRNADMKKQQDLSEIMQNIQPKIPQLIALGGACLLYAVLMRFVIDSDIQGLAVLTQNKTTMTESQMIIFLQKVFPFLLKFTLLLIPLMMATWFSPMLIAYNNYNVVKALKSSVAGSLQYMVALGVSWLLLTLGVVALMLVVGIIAGIVSGLVPVLGQMMMSFVVFGCLLLATALMLAFQYVSYRDVFRAA